MSRYVRSHARATLPARLRQRGCATGLRARTPPPARQAGYAIRADIRTVIESNELQRIPRNGRHRPTLDTPRRCARKNRCAMARPRQRASILQLVSRDRRARRKSFSQCDADPHPKLHQRLLGRPHARTSADRNVFASSTLRFCLLLGTCSPNSLAPAATPRSLFVGLSRSDVALPSLRFANSRAGAPDHLRNPPNCEREVVSA